MPSNESALWEKWHLFFARFKIFLIKEIHMPEITRQRTGQFLQIVFKFLLGKPDGLPAKDILAEIPKAVTLTKYESGYYPSTPNSPRYEKIVRFATIDLVKAGWLVKTAGRWFITEEGRLAYKKFINPEEFYKEAVRLYREWKKNRIQDEGLDDIDIEETPRVSLTLEEVEELAKEQIQIALNSINPYEFQDLVAELLKAMGYYIYWVAPPGKDGGIDIIAYNDPLGANGPRVKVQVKHKLGQTISVEPLRAFMSVIGVDEIGLYVSSGGFTSTAYGESRSQEKRKITLVDLESLIRLWIEYYPKLSQEARQKLPLKPVYFPAPAE
jgi:restriction system protein